MVNSVGVAVSDETHTVQDAAQSPGSVVVVPRRWLRFLRRCLGLGPGRYLVVLSVYGDGTDWSVQEVGRVEK